MTENKGDLISRSEVVKTLENIEIGKFNRVNVIETIKSISTEERPQGDLISRSELYREIESLNVYGTIDNENDALLKGSEVFDLIDNAPTIETDIEVVAKDAYEHGYTDGWKERFGEPDERPQGEWIKKVDDVGFISHICSKCGAEIEVEDPCDNKFCWNCGAKMGGKEE